MNLTLELKKCIGCGVCMQIAPDIFTLNESTGLAAIVRNEENDAVNLAIKSCPVSCISKK